MTLTLTVLSKTFGSQKSTILISENKERMKHVHDKSCSYFSYYFIILIYINGMYFYWTGRSLYFSDAYPGVSFDG